MWGNSVTHQLLDLMLSLVHLLLLRRKSGIFLVIGKGVAKCLDSHCRAGLSEEVNQPLDLGNKPSGLM